MIKSIFSTFERIKFQSIFYICNDEPPISLSTLTTNYEKIDIFCQKNIFWKPNNIIFRKITNNSLNHWKYWLFPLWIIKDNMNIYEIIALKNTLIKIVFFFRIVLFKQKNISNLFEKIFLNRFGEIYPIVWFSRNKSIPLFFYI